MANDNITEDTQSETVASECRRHAASHEQVHRDIALGNQYRLELSKLLLTLAVGLFAFTVAFPPTVTIGTEIHLMMAGWACLTLSIIGGVGNLYGWEKFYLTYRDYDYRGQPEEGKRKRKRITALRRIARIAQFAGIILGTSLIGWFTADNIQYRAPEMGNGQESTGQ